MREQQPSRVSIGNDLKNFQNDLGLDPAELERADTNIRESMEKVNTASDMIGESMDMISATTEADDLSEDLRAELMAEITSGAGEEEALEAKLAKKGL